MFSGIVVKTTGSWHWVKLDDGSIIPCRLKGKFRIKGIRTTNPLAVGDQVAGALLSGEEGGMITKLFPRRNYVIRKATKLSSESHILASNVDQALLMVTLRSPVTLSMFVDRFLVSAEAYEIPVRLLFNKTDLYVKKDLHTLDYWTNAYSLAGYPCHPISIQNRAGIDELLPHLKNRLSLLAGNSGVGKSSLINLLKPGAKLKTASLSVTHSTGKHTTTFPEMIELPGSGSIIDTPGIRGFGMIDINKIELYHFFPEIFRASKQCQFHNCTHTHEPGCKIPQAIEEGLVAEMRYLNYLSMMDSDNEKHRQAF